MVYIKRCKYLFAMERNAEQNDTAEALLDERSEELFEFVHAPTRLAGKRGNFDMGIRLIRDEYGVHEHRFCESALSLP